MCVFSRVRCHSCNSCMDPLVELLWSCTDGLKQPSVNRKDLHISEKDKKGHGCMVRCYCQIEDDRWGTAFQKYEHVWVMADACSIKQKKLVCVCEEEHLQSELCGDGFMSRLMTACVNLAFSRGESSRQWFWIWGRRLCLYEKGASCVYIHVLSVHEEKTEKCAALWDSPLMLAWCVIYWLYYWTWSACRQGRRRRRGGEVA